MSHGPAAGPSPVRPSPVRMGAAPRVPQAPGSTATRGGKTMLGDKYMLGEELGRGAYGQVGLASGALLCASVQALPACVLIMPLSQAGTQQQRSPLACALGASKRLQPRSRLSWRAACW